ncbi:unnamed protein product [Gordionus sp. m RMFG-2023]
MHEVAWENNNDIFSPVQDSNSNKTNSTNRSQDDAMVRYFFQRPQNNPENNLMKQKWALGDDSILHQVKFFR